MMAQSAFAARKAAQLRDNPNDFRGSSTQIQYIDHGDDAREEPQERELKPRRKRRKFESGTTISLDGPPTKLIYEDDAGDGKSISIKKQSATAQTRGHAGTDQIAPEIQINDQPTLDLEEADKTTFKSLQLNFQSKLVWDDAYRTVDINLQPGSSVSVVGEYDLWVKKGSIRLLGATIHASSKTFRIHSFTAHAVPSIEALSNPFGPASQDIDICLSSCSSGLRRLRQCDTRFSGIWQRHECTPASFEVVSGISLESDIADPC